MSGVVAMFAVWGCNAAERSDGSAAPTLAFTDVNVIDVSTGAVLSHRTVRIAGELRDSVLRLEIGAGFLPASSRSGARHRPS